VCRPTFPVAHCTTLYIPLSFTGPEDRGRGSAGRVRRPPR
jgi:hypothetical protein